MVSIIAPRLKAPLWLCRVGYMFSHLFLPLALLVAVLLVASVNESSNQPKELQLVENGLFVFSWIVVSMGLLFFRRMARYLAALFASTLVMIAVAIAIMFV